MKALLLAAGKGTRLGKITENKPKCLLEIGGKPILEIWLEKLSEIGVNDVLVNTHFLAEQVSDFLLRSKFKNIKIEYENELLGTGGTILANKSYFADDNFIIIHADNYYSGDLDSLIKKHMSRPEKCILTMLTFHPQDKSKCGMLKVDNRGVMISFEEKPIATTSNLANAAIYVTTPEILDILSEFDSKAIDFSSEVIPNLTGAIYTYFDSEGVIDIGTPEDLKRARDKAIEQESRS